MTLSCIKSPKRHNRPKDFSPEETMCTMPGRIHQSSLREKVLLRLYHSITVSLYCLLFGDK